MKHFHTFAILFIDWVMTVIRGGTLPFFCKLSCYSNAWQSLHSGDICQVRLYTPVTIPLLRARQFDLLSTECLLQAV